MGERCLYIANFALTLGDFSDHCEDMAPNLIMIMVIIVIMKLILLREVSQERNCRGVAAQNVTVVFI